MFYNIGPSSQIFEGKARILPKGGAPLGYAPALPVSKRLGWKSLPRTKTLAYYAQLQIMDIKSFITVGIGVIFTLNFLHSLRMGPIS
jgi:hypothetical protein